MSAYRIVVSKKTYSKTNVGDYVKVGKEVSINLIVHIQERRLQYHFMLK